MAPDFVNLHCHSELSQLDGFGHISEYVDRVVELNQKGLGITDHGNTFGIASLFQIAKKNNIIPVPGIEMYMAPMNPEGAKVKKKVYYGRDRFGNTVKAGRNDVSGDGSFTHQTIFAVNNTGLRNLFILSSLGFQPENFYSKPRIDFDMLAEHSEGLVIGTGCPSSEISTRFLIGQEKEAYEYAGRLLDIFGKERMFVEIMNHNMKTSLERDLIVKQMELSKKLGLELLATNDSHYTRAGDVLHHEQMLCIQSGDTMDVEPDYAGGTRFAFDGNQYYLKSAEEMELLFPERDFPRALSNTVLITEMAQDISMGYDPKLSASPAIPQNYSSDIDYFKQLIKEGFKKRRSNQPIEIQRESRAKIKEELSVIVPSNYVPYFLTVIEYLNWTREKFSTRDKSGEIIASAVGAGRGSAGGSEVAYLTGITDVDPIRYGLVFERFLSAGRGSTYEIVYEDGTVEKVIASESKLIKKDD